LISTEKSARPFEQSRLMWFLNAACLLSAGFAGMATSDNASNEYPRIDEERYSSITQALKASHLSSGTNSSKTKSTRMVDVYTTNALYRRQNALHDEFIQEGKRQVCKRRW